MIIVKQNRMTIFATLFCMLFSCSDGDDICENSEYVNCKVNMEFCKQPYQNLKKAISELGKNKIISFAKNEKWVSPDSTFAWVKCSRQPFKYCETPYTNVRIGVDYYKDSIDVKCTSFKID